MRLAAPPDDRQRPDAALHIDRERAAVGETPTDIDVPSLTVTSTRVGAGAAPNAPAATVRANKALRITKRLRDRD